MPVIRSSAATALTLVAVFFAAAKAHGQPPSDSAPADAASRGSRALLEPSEPQTFGWIEQVILSPELQWKLDAKLDTGADTSSLDAHKIRRVRYKGKSYVRFSIKNPESGEMVSLRRPYVRTVRIRRHTGNHQRRRVALMTVCLGNVERTIEVTLTDREYFDYPMLLGRSALAGLAVVDPMATYTRDPDCRPALESDPIDAGETADDSDAGVTSAPRDFLSSGQKYSADITPVRASGEPSDGVDVMRSRGVARTRTGD
ncbi:MAG: ATP-dependent zinc protease [Pseudomonadota bacterium]